MYDIAIIGAGVIGSFIARELARYNLSICVLEKNSDVGSETSSANSAIVHSGYDPLPGSLKAKLNVLGNSMFDQVCEELDVSFSRIGSITLAIYEEDLKTLNDLQKRATENGVETKLLSKEELLKLEPGLTDNVLGGLLAPSSGIINPFTLVVHLMENAIDNGVKLMLNYQVNSIKKIDDHFIINNEIETKLVINCAGVYSDKINELVNEPSFKIIPRKGEYYVLNHFNNMFVRHTLFMVPSAKGKGVLISPTTSYNYLIGPSAEEVLDYNKMTDKQTLAKIKNDANLMIKNIPYFFAIRTFAGVRATPSTHDFIIEESETKGFINVAGIESPGIASSPAIAKMVVEIVGNIMPLTKNDKFNPCVKKQIKISDLPFEEKQKLFALNPAYGNIICKCEQVSEGEIIDCLNRSCPPHTVAGLRRRLRVGFGGCQGGMCQSNVINLLAKFYNVDKKEVEYENKGSFILKEETKGGTK